MLKKDIQNATTEALKAGNHFLVETLRMLLAAIQTKEKDKRYKVSKDPAFAKASAGEEKLDEASRLTDGEILEVVSSEIKKRKDAIALYTQGKRPELAEREQKEIDILIKYLPAQLSGEELKKLVAESITTTGATSIKDMGKVMADLNPKTKGRADSGDVSKIVKELLAK